MQTDYLNHKDLLEENGELKKHQANYSKLAPAQKKENYLSSDGGDFYRRIIEKQEQLVCALTAGFKIIYANQAFCRFFNTTPEAAERRRFTYFLPPGKRKDFMNGLKAASPEKPVFYFCIKHQRSKELSIWQEWQGYVRYHRNKPLGIYLTGIDITRQKELEEAVQLNKERYYSIAERYNEQVCRFLPDTTLLYVNEAFCQYFGRKKEELVGSSLLCLIAEEDRVGVLNLIEMARPLDSYCVYPWRVIRADGQIAWLEWFSWAIFNGEGKLVEFQAVGRDVADRWEIEEALRESEACYRTIFETTGTAMIIYDEDKLISLANSEFEKLSGYSKEEIENKMYWTEFVVDEDVGFMSRYHSIRAFYPEAAPSSYEFRFRDRWGNVKEVFLTLGFISANNNRVASFTDITERKKTEKELRLSQEKFSKAFNSSPSLMAITTIEEDRYIDVNQQFCAVTGYEYNEVIGQNTRNFSIWFKNEDRKQFLDILSKDGTVRNLEIVFKIKSGEIRIGLLSAEALDLHGEACMIMMITDITELKQMEQEMARLDQLNLIGEIAASIGHEVRNPMTSVRGFLQMMGESESSPMVKEYYKLMIEEIDRANQIITEFLLLARNKKVDLKMENLNAIIDNVSPLIIADAVAQDKYVELSLQDVPELMLDEKEIRQLLFNLARNGLEAMNPGGRLKIKTEAGKNETVLIIEDEGKGIDTEIIDKIAVPFFTTKKEGTGLGLSVCYSIAARHRAFIKINSSSTGTCFSVHFSKGSRQPNYK